jgi:hypothetical protein
VLPAQSVCLQVPIVMPDEYSEEWAAKKRGQARAKQGELPTSPANSVTEGRQQ